MAIPPGLKSYRARHMKLARAMREIERRRDKVLRSVEAFDQRIVRYGAGFRGAHHERNQMTAAMTHDDFAALARQTGLSDARLGLALGAQGARENVAARVRQWKRGARPIPDHVGSLLRALVSGLQGERLADTDAAIEGAIDRVQPPEWLIAVEPPGGEDDAPEYLVHTRRPRFICEIFDEEVDGPAPPSSFAYADTEGTVLTRFLWLDAMPDDDAALRELMRRAIAAIEGE